jgi:hypothetical protein
VPEHTSQSPEPEYRFEALRIADEVFDADDEDSDDDSDNTTTPVASSPQIYRFSTADFSPPSASLARLLTVTPPSSPPAAPVFAPWQLETFETVPPMPFTPRIQPIEHVTIPTLELLPRRARPSTDPVFVCGGNVFFGGR